MAVGQSTQDLKALIAGMRAGAMALEPLQGTQAAAKSIARVNYSHDAMVDAILADPGITQNDLAAMFGYTVGWVSQVRNSDAFLKRLAEKKAMLTDVNTAFSIEEKFRAVLDESLNVLHEKVTLTRNPELALKTGDLAVRALGYGVRNPQVQVNNSFVVALPEKAATAQQWAERYERPTAIPAN